MPIMRSLNGGWSYSWQGDKADECAEAYHTITKPYAINMAEIILFMNQALPMSPGKALCGGRRTNRK